MQNDKFGFDNSKIETEFDKIKQIGTGNTNVNIPRYMYMAFCCSDQLQGFVSEGYVVFEHQIKEDKQRSKQMRGDQVHSIHPTAASLLKQLELLWKKEHRKGVFKRGTMEDPILFKIKGNDDERCGGGFDIEPKGKDDEIPYNQYQSSALDYYYYSLLTRLGDDLTDGWRLD